MTIPRVFLKVGLCLAAMVASVSLLAAPAFNRPVTIAQPDGTKVQCFGSGDEYGFLLFDKDGYTLVKDADGMLKYAVKDAQGELAPSAYPANKARGPGLRPLLDLSPASRERNLNVFRKKYGPMPGDADFPVLHMKDLLANAAGTTTGGTKPAATQYSTLSRSAGFTNLVVLIRFKDTKFSMSKSTFDMWFNSSSQASLKDYYLEHSHGALNIDSYLCAKSGSDVNTVCYVDENPIGYYCTKTDANPIGGKADAGAMKKRAYQWIIDNNLIPGSKNLDANNDGRVDSICIIYATEVSSEGRTAIKDLLPTGFDPADYNPTIGWAEALWPHSGGMGGFSFNGKSTSSYIQQWGDGTSVSLGVFCHEMGHLLGAPDYYRYSTSGTPIGGWSHMASSPWGMPIGLDMWTRYKYHQFQPDGNADGNPDGNDIPEITKTGTYTLYPSYTKPDANADPTKGKNVAYRIRSKTSNQFYMVEYRKIDGNSYDQQLGATSMQGMLVYRVNTTLGGNAGGPPDEIYIYRPGETHYTGNCAGDLGKAAFSKDSSRTQFTNSTDPRCFLEDDSDGGLRIMDVSAAGETITFSIVMDGLPYLKVDPMTATVPSKAGTVQNYKVTAENTTWTASSTTSWATVTTKTDGSGFSVVATSDNNGTTDRIATITVKPSSSGVDSISVTFIQAHPENTELVVTPLTQTIKAAAASVVYTVEKVPDNADGWTATETADWITLTLDVAKKTITAAATANTAAAARTGEITVTAGEKTVKVTLTQKAAGETSLIVTPATQALAAAGGTVTFSVTELPTGETTWNATAALAWVTLEKKTDTVPPTLLVSAAANTGTSRTAEIVFSSGTESVIVTVTQAGSTTTLTVKPSITSIITQDTNATIDCALDYSDGAAVTECGICWSVTHQLPSVNDDTVAKAAAVATTYTINLSSLISGKKHYARAYAKVADGTVYYSNTSSFTPKVVPPPTVFSGLRQQGYYSVLFIGAIQFQADELILERGFLYGENPGLQYDATTAIKKGAGRGTFSSALRNSSAVKGKVYYMCAYAKTKSGVVLGNEIAFEFKIP